MKGPTIKSGTATLTIRWIARTWSIASMGLLLLFLIGEGFDPAKVAFSEWFGLLFFPRRWGFAVIAAHSTQKAAATN